MAITRTAKGTASDKSSSLTLTLSSIQVARRLLIVGITYDDGNGHPVVKWGGVMLVMVERVIGNGIVSATYAYRRRRDAKTKNIVAKWTTTGPTAKALYATTIAEVASLDLKSSLAQAGTTAPNSGTAATSNTAKEIFIGTMGSEGPSSDAAGTPQDSYTAGQRVGTTGSPPISNVTCQEIFKIVSATESTQAKLSGVTSRDWCSVLTTWSDDNRSTFNTTQHDYDDLEDIADSNDQDDKDYFIAYNILLGQNEMFHVDPDTGVRTLKATWKPNTSGWITV